MPLIVGNTVIGVYCVDTSEPDCITPEHVRLAEAMAVGAAIAIQHSRLFEQVGEGRDRQGRLSQQLLKVQDVERREIARELHDEIGLALTTLRSTSRHCRASSTPTRLDGASTRAS
jgi:glucose-6-phosphate-specific signal transduction histidine kinase